MTNTQVVFAKGNLKTNKLTLKEIKPSYFSQRVVGESLVEQIVSSIVQEDLFDVTVANNSSDKEVAHRYTAFKHNTDTHLIIVDLVRKTPFEPYVPQIRHPKNMKQYLQLVDFFTEGITEEHSKLLCKLLSFMRPSDASNFSMDTDIDKDQCNVSIECLKTRLWINLFVDLKELKKLK